jgi:hypothetical protein
MAGLPGAAMWLESHDREQAARTLRVTVPADALAKLPIFVVAPCEGEERETFAFELRSADGEGESDRTEAIFERPEK